MTLNNRAADRRLIFALVVASTLLGIMGTDLVLPAVPGLPELFGSNPARAQLVLAAYVGGTCIGLLGYGALGDPISTRAIFAGSLLATAVVSLACTAADTIETLIALRALQGAVAAGPAVFAPGIMRALFEQQQAVRALGLLGSIESLAPALAPILGVWLITVGGWQLTFHVIGILAILLAGVCIWKGLPQTARRPQGSYLKLLTDLVFLRYALSQALVLGGLLTFVFALPAVLVRTFGGTLGDFILIQVCGIIAFAIASNLSASLVSRFGAERVIKAGTLLAMLGAFAIFDYALLGGRSPLVIVALFLPVNIGFGFRGPPGFFRAVVAARGDDARGAALVILFMLGSAAAGTAAAAPFIENGMAPTSGIALVLQIMAVLCLLTMPSLDKAGEPAIER